MLGFWDWICDWIWVIYAYILGKWFHSQRFAPTCTIRNNANRLSFPMKMTYGRVTKLLRLWRHGSASVMRMEKELRERGDKTPLFWARWIFYDGEVVDYVPSWIRQKSRR